MTRRAIFFDRDDTLMVNVPYLGDPAKVEAFDEAAEALGQLRQAGFMIFVVSNQSGVGRGLITRRQVDLVNAELVRQLGANYIHTFYHSFATPDDPAPSDRKPSPRILFQAAKEHDLDLEASFFIGDRLSDIECGIAAGCRTIFLIHAKSSRRESHGAKENLARQKADFMTENLLDATHWILQQISPLP